MVGRLYHGVRMAAELPFRNLRGIDKSSSKRKQVNLEWVDNGNLGDALGPVVYEWMLSRRGLKPDAPVGKTRHLLTCGSLIGVGTFDAVVWGSGAHVVPNIRNLIRLKGIRKYDVRAVRGPVTRTILTECGYECPEIYGDPAVLTPLIYQPPAPEKKYDVSIALHYHRKEREEYRLPGSRLIDLGTGDYRKAIDEIRASRLVVSSSLHGIILAEAYGVPTVFLNSGGYVDRALMKYYDWYYSTGRWSVKMAKTVQEAVELGPAPLPDLSAMQERLLAAFPYDLWEARGKREEER